MKIRILPTAEQDLAISADFYEMQFPGLGAYFTECLTSDIDKLARFAGIHSKYRDYHRSISSCDFLQD